jgi:geranylgeranyl diphosphate synthase type I
VILGRLGAADLGRDEVDAIRDVFARTGAVESIEFEIARLVGDARIAIDDAPLADDARRWLDELAVYVAWRDR